MDNVIKCLVQMKARSGTWVASGDEVRLQFAPPPQYVRIHQLRLQPLSYIINHVPTFVLSYIYDCGPHPNIQRFQTHIHVTEKYVAVNVTDTSIYHVFFSGKYDTILFV